MTRYFPYLLIFAIIGAAMEIDLSLPSFPDIARAFGVTEEMVERTISINFLGFCFSALFYGPLADRFGRRPLMIIGTSLFLLGSAGCAVAPSIELIIISRFVQGLGAAASFVIAFTMISDVYKGNEATAWIGLINALVTGAMAGAPILGGLLNAYFGWQSCYTFIALWSVIAFFLLLFFLPETRKGQYIHIKDVQKDYIELLLSKQFLRSSLIPTLIAGAYMSFVAIIPFLYRDQLQMPLRDFSLHQAAIIASFSLMSYYASRIADFFGEKRSVLVGMLITTLATGTLLLLAFFQKVPSAWKITPLMSLFAGTCAVGFAVVFAASLGQFPEKNGPASSLIMSMRTLVCAGTVQLSGWLYNGTLFPTAMIVVTCCLISYLLAINFYAPEKVVSSYETARIKRLKENS